MKGVVFVELLELLDDRFSMEFTEKVIEVARVPSAGAYNALGQFDHRELLALMEAYESCSHDNPTPIYRELGQRLVTRCITEFPTLFRTDSCLSDTLGHMESLMHMDDLLVDQSSELPEIKLEQVTERQLVLDYFYDPRLADFTIGLIHGCAEYHKLESNVHCLPMNHEGIQATRFLISMSEMKYGRLGDLQEAV